MLIVLLSEPTGHVRAPSDCGVEHINLGPTSAMLGGEGVAIALDVTVAAAGVARPVLR